MTNANGVAYFGSEIMADDPIGTYTIEAGVSMGWERYVGDRGAVIAMSGFGASAPGGEVLSHFGFTADNVVEKALDLCQK